jgi:hypothetical protein
VAVLAPSLASAAAVQPRRRSRITPRATGEWFVTQRAEIIRWYELSCLALEERTLTTVLKSTQLCGR